MSRELDALVDVKIMGHACSGNWTLKSFAGEMWEECETCETDRHDYSIDLNACRLAELRIVEMGLGNLYRQTLEGWIRAGMWAAQGHETGWEDAVFLAPADSRCRAMLAALEGGG